MNMDTIICEENKALVLAVSKNFYGENKEDLCQAGFLGLLKAYRNYEDNATCKFSSYAYKYIYGEMYNLVSSKHLKISKEISKLCKLIEKTRSLLMQKYNREVSNEDISNFLNIPLNKINEAFYSMSEIVSLENDDYTLSNQKQYAFTPNTDEKILIDESMEVLSKDEADIIKARFYEDLTQSETAKKLCMTQVMVSRYEKSSLNKMYAFLQK